MNIITNEPLIKRNKRIAQLSMIAGLAVLGGGMYVSYKMPEQFGLSLGALILGFGLSQLGIFFTKRWGRSPRPDELINQALKGLDSKYTLYHYRTPTSHLLVGPGGVWVLMVRHIPGVISFSNGRWRQRGGNLYLKIFGQETLGRPDLEIGFEMENVEKFLKRILPEEKVPPIQAALTFAHPKVEIDISPDDKPPVETVMISKLKEVIRKTPKGKTISPEKAKEIQDAIEANLK